MDDVPATNSGRSQAEALQSPVAGKLEGMPAQVVYVGSCNIETIDGANSLPETNRLRTTDALTVSGWAVDERTHRSPARMAVVLEAVATSDKWYVPIAARARRDDVAERRNTDLFSGFVARAQLTRIPPGQYRVLLYFWDAALTQSCDNGSRILIQ